jgi:hypothetical protein
MLPRAAGLGFVVAEIHKGSVKSSIGARAGNSGIGMVWALESAGGGGLASWG